MDILSAFVSSAARDCRIPTSNHLDPICYVHLSQQFLILVYMAYSRREPQRMLEAMMQDWMRLQQAQR